VVSTPLPKPRTACCGWSASVMASNAALARQAGGATLAGFSRPGGVRPVDEGVSLPSAIASGSAVTLVSWISQTFLQLVLLSVIIVGQNVQAAASDRRAEATFHDASATLHEVAHVQGHLAAQDELLTRIAAKIGMDPVPVIDNPALDETADPDPGC